MREPSEDEPDPEDLRRAIVGLGERSLHKSYYRELQQRGEELERFRALLDESRDGILTVEIPGGRIVDFNRAAASLFGTEGGGLEGALLDERLPPSLAHRLRPLVACDGPAETLIVSGSTSMGRMVELTARPAEFRARRYLVVIARDVTERAQLEERLRHGDRLGALGLMAGQLAHEIRNRLMGIQGFADLMEDDLRPDSPARPQLEGIQACCTSLDEVVRRLLRFARKSTTDRGPLDLNRVAGDVGDLAALWSTSRLEVRQELHPEPLPIEGNLHDLQTAVLNLVTNARDAMPDGGALILGTTRTALDEASCGPLPQGLFAEAYVRDTGVGVPEEVLPRILEPFFTTKAVGKGTGLGLAMVNRIVEEHEGALFIESVPGEGSTFRILLPLWA